MGLFRPLGLTAPAATALAPRAMVAARLRQSVISPKLEEDLIRASGAVSAFCRRNMFWHEVEERIPAPLPGSRCRDEYTLGCWPVGRIFEARDGGGNALPLEGLVVTGQYQSTLELPAGLSALRRVRFTAGFLSPDLAVAWAASTSVAAGAWTAPASSGMRFVATIAAGATGATEPVWPLQVGAEVVDGGVIWVAENSIPPSLSQQHAVAAFAELIYTGAWDIHRLGVIAESGPAGYIGYLPSGVDMTDAMPRPIIVEWGQWGSPKC